MAELGLYGIAVPEEVGGPGLDTLAYAVVMEELSRGYVSVADQCGLVKLISTSLVRHGTAGQRERWLAVVADPFIANAPSGLAALDWEATMRFRRYLAELGLGIAEAMDTAQWGIGLDWPGALEPIGRCPTSSTASSSRIAATCCAIRNWRLGA